MGSSIRRRSGLTDEWIGCGDIGSSSRAEGRPFMLGARPGLPQPLIAAYECARPRPKHPSRGAGSCMGAVPPWSGRKRNDRFRAVGLLERTSEVLWTRRYVLAKLAWPRGA